METLYADLAVSMTDFKKNPAKILREAGKRPVAVLNHNKASFYLVDPALFEALLESSADARLASVIEDRLARRSEAVEVDIDEI